MQVKCVQSVGRVSNVLCLCACFACLCVCLDNVVLLYLRFPIHSVRMSLTIYIMNYPITIRCMNACATCAVHNACKLILSNVCVTYVASKYFISGIYISSRAKSA